MLFVQLLLPLLLFHAHWVDYCNRQNGPWPNAAVCLAEEPDCIHPAVTGEWIIAMGPPLMDKNMVCKYKTLPKFITGERYK